MSERSHILVVDDDRALAELLRRILLREGYDVTVAHTGEDALEHIHTQTFDVALLDVMLPGMDGYSVCRRIRQDPAIKNIPVLMLTAKGDIADRIAGFEAGADDYLTKPFQPKELAFRVRALVGRRTENTGTRPLVDEKQGYVVAVFGSKGGVGKTTIATNLAVAVRERCKRKVALFDADFFSGDVGVHLNVPTICTILDMLESASALDSSVAERVMVPHTTGVNVLLSPFRPEEGQNVTEEDIKIVLDFLATLYDFVIIDCQPSYDERMMRILRRADDVLVVVTPEVGPLKNTSLFFDWATRLNLPMDRLKIAVNRFNSNVGIGSDEIERTLQHEVMFRIISGGRAVVSSVNRGIPLVVEQPEHPFSMQIARIADYYIERARATRTTRTASLSL
jgi:pilus assembly protein CpaE